MVRARLVLAATAYLLHAALATQWGHRLAGDGPPSNLLWLLLVVLLWSLAVGFIVAGVLVERDRRRARAEYDEAEAGDEDEDEDSGGRLLH